MNDLSYILASDLINPHASSLFHEHAIDLIITNNYNP